MSSHSFRHTPSNPAPAELGFKANPLSNDYEKSPCLSHPMNDGEPCVRAWKNKDHYTCANCAHLKRGKADCFDPTDYTPPGDVSEYRNGRRTQINTKKNCAMKECSGTTKGTYCSAHSGLAAARKSQWTKQYGDRPIDLDWLHRPTTPNDKTRRRRGGRPRVRKAIDVKKVDPIDFLKGEIKHHEARIKAIKAAIDELQK